MTDDSELKGISGELREISLDVRVRYVECDPMGVVHHSVYPVWLEMARTELLRRQGFAYRELEARGVYFVVARLNLRYQRPARYDDALTIHAKVEPTAGVKIEHRYRVCRGQQLVARAESTIVCVDEDGALQRVPAELGG